MIHSISYYLGRDIRGDEYEQVWNQLEAEIHLHRHKTVIRACRQNLVLQIIIMTHYNLFA